MEHVQLTALTKSLAPDLESAMTWVIGSVEHAAATMPPLSFSPMLLTDAGSAVFGHYSWFKMEPSVGERINSFVQALRPTWVVVAYCSGSDKRRESPARCASRAKTRRSRDRHRQGVPTFVAHSS